jgi:hypothetical protein
MHQTNTNTVIHRYELTSNFSALERKEGSIEFNLQLAAQTRAAKIFASTFSRFFGLFSRLNASS